MDDEVSFQDSFAHRSMVGKLRAVECGFTAGSSLRELVFVARVACFTAGATRDAARLAVVIAKLGRCVLALVVLTRHRALELRAATPPVIRTTQAVFDHDEHDPCTNERQRGEYRCCDEQKNGPNFVIVAPFPGDLRKHLVVEVETFHEEFVHGHILGLRVDVKV